MRRVSELPRLGAWLGAFALPSVLALLATYAGLRFLFRDALSGTAAQGEGVSLSTGGRLALIGIGATATLLTIASAVGWDLGWPTFGAGLATAIAVQARAGETPLPLLRRVSWSVLLLVAGLFVMVEALAETGLIQWLATQVMHGAASDLRATAAAAGGLLAVGSNAINNLPAGLIAAQTIAAAHPPKLIVDALLIGVDLGPNLSITGSLATILWLIAIRREGEDVSFFQFLRVGVVTTVPALILAIGVRVLLGPGTRRASRVCDDRSAVLIPPTVTSALAKPSLPLGAKRQSARRRAASSSRRSGVLASSVLTPIRSASASASRSGRCAASARRNVVRGCWRFASISQPGAALGTKSMPIVSRGRQ
ncbi:hypothetical protein WR25_16006 [Diploscapter pachys]|uniref:Citrate transporter-like domain-containing protein n=1 Tax=Diploscapter pachys TaxID=2018661 RepID=A0A2A2M343_9BILA|nr:hypothetical protein WR25_16006 [Diploscapter pachys]